MNKSEIKPNNSVSGNLKGSMIDDSFVSSPLSEKSKLTENDSLLKTNITNITNKTPITNKTINTSILDNPVKKPEVIYYYLFDNGDSTTENIIKFAEITKDNFYNMKGRDKNIEKIKTVNKTAYYNISEQTRKEIEFKINQKVESLKRIEQNKADEEKRQKEESATQDELLIKVKDMIDDKDVFSFESGESKFNLQEMKEAFTEVYELLMERPEETIQLLEIAVFEKDFGEIPLRFTNLSAIKKLNIENYRAKDIGKVVCSEAKVTTISSIRPLVTNAKFECPSCGTIISVLQVEKKFKEPSRCSCGRRGGFKELSKDMVDGAILIAEDIEPESQIPTNKSIPCFLKGKLIHPRNIEKLNPGNDIRIFGVLKEVAVSTIGGAMLTRMDLAIEVFDVEEFDPELNATDFSEEDIKEFNELSAKINKEGLDTLTESYAPEVEGYKPEKKALMIQGAQKKNTGKGDNTKSHIAIFGDPGVSKSVLSKFVTKVTQGSSYSSGSGSSGVGLTASVIKDDNIGWVMKPGQLPLTRELAVLDEYNLVSDEDKPKLQEAMSEAKISINKAGISASPTVSCGVLALANPIRGVFDEQQSLTKQLNLPPQQLNRFDTIFIQRDKQDPELDGKIADIMLKRKSGQIESDYDIKFLRKFFTYIRGRDEPTLTIETTEEIKKYFLKARENTRKDTSALINPRFLDALTRFAVGHAKLRGSNKVVPNDVIVAYSILSASYLNLNRYIS